MGNPAVRSLTGNYGLKITKIRGQLIPSTLAELGILPVVHPAALMRGTGSFRQFRQDLEYALELADGGTPRSYHEVPHIWIKDPRELARRVVRMLDKTNDLTCDIETEGFSHVNDHILSISIHTTLDAPSEEFPVLCFTPDLLPVVRRYYESPHVKWCWHNGKFDVKFFWRKGIRARVDDDTMLLSYAQDENGGVHDLEQVAQDVLDAPDYKYVMAPYKPKKGDPRSPHYYMWQGDPEGLMRYMSIDCANTSRVREVYRPRVLKDKPTNRLYTKTLIPASQLVAEVEYAGIHVDQEWLNDADEIVRQDVIDAAHKIVTECGFPVNPASSQQMSDVLFKHFKLPNRYKGSTDKNVLKKLSENPKTRHPIVLQLLDFRKKAKVYGTYIVGLRKHIHDDGRVYATFLLHGTVTGRLSSRKPNLQNIPRDWIVRGIFDASPGYVLVEVDLSQAELRSLAALSGDEEMCKLYLEGGDIHSELARFLYPGWDERSSAPQGSYEQLQAYEERVKCKNVNFGIVYGITEFGLQDQIGGSIETSRKMIEGWGERFPEAWKFIETCRRTPHTGQVITTCFGRKKRVGLVTMDNLHFLQNQSANFPHQSIASDITLHAAMRSKEQLRKWGVKIVNLIHDSMLMEVPISGGWELQDHVIQLVSNHLEQVPKDWGITRVPFKADAKVGERWGSLEDWKEAA
jgi:DNA polymerase-1